MWQVDTLITPGAQVPAEPPERFPPPAGAVLVVADHLGNRRVMVQQPPPEAWSEIRSGPRQLLVGALEVEGTSAASARGATYSTVVFRPEER